MIKGYAVSQMKNKARPTVVIVIAANEYRGPKEGEPGFYDTLKWSLYSLGIKNVDAKTLAWRHSVRVDKDLSLGLRNLIGLPTEMSRDFYFVHKYNSCPSYIIEYGFSDNATDSAYLLANWEEMVRQASEKIAAALLE